MLGIVAGCSTMIPGEVVRGQNAVDVSIPHPTKETLNPAPEPNQAAPQLGLLTVEHTVPTAQMELPQPKLFPPQPKLFPPQPKKEANPFITKSVEPEATSMLELTVGLSRILQFKEAPKRIQMDTEEKGGVAGFKVITEKEVSVIGHKPGQTVLNLWFTDPKDGTTKLYSYLVRVSPDPQAQIRVREQLNKYYKQLEREINDAFPDSRVQLNIVGSRLVVCGQAHDVVQAAQIIRILTPRTGGQANQNPRGLTTVVQHGLEQSKATTKVDENPEEQEEDGLNPYFRGQLQIVNMLRVPGEQQVLLKVVVAEVDRAAANSLGLNFNIRPGNNNISNLTGNTSGSSNTTGGVAGTTSLTAPGANLPIVLDGGRVALAITALKNRNLARTLAEPTLVALNGQSASFRAGGEFPVPVVTGYTAAGLQGVSFVPFGVQVQFTPIITDKDRIRLQVNADVSTRDQGSGASVGGTAVPGLNSRTFQTTVELRGGETMAVAGLIQSNYGATSARIPFFGDIPVIGRIFGGSDQTSAGQQELVILITPVLARPLDPGHTRPVPGSDMFEPSDAEFYLHGRLESHRAVDYQSPIRTDLHRMMQYHREVRPAYESPQGAAPSGPINTNHSQAPRGYQP